MTLNTCLVPAQPGALREKLRRGGLPLVQRVFYYAFSIIGPAIAIISLKGELYLLTGRALIRVRLLILFWLFHIL